MGVSAESQPADVLDAMVDYLVDTPDGSVGILDGWERDQHARPWALIVAQGWFGRRRFIVPLELLLEVDHERRRVVLARGAAQLEPKGPLQRLVELGDNRWVEEARAARPPDLRTGPDCALWRRE